MSTEHSSEVTWEIITQALLPRSTKAEKLQRKVQAVLLILGQSAFAEVHFCISEHTNSSACSNSVFLSLPPCFSLSLPLRQLMTTAQQQHCLISSVFLNLGCQGSLVGGCLLYFSYKKSIRFFLSSLRQWLIQRTEPYQHWVLKLLLLLPILKCDFKRHLKVTFKWINKKK